MRKLVMKTTACCILSTCLIAGTTVLGSAGNTAADLPAGGIAGILSDYCTTDSKLPSAGVTLTLDEYAVSSADTALIESVSKVSEEYRKIVIAQVDGYVNVRAAANENAEIVGKLYDNAAATILKDAGGWYQVTSGNVTGYVKKDCIVEGEEAQLLGKTVGQRIATAKETANIYAAMDVSSQVLFIAEPQETVQVVEEVGEFVRVTYAGSEGYMQADKVELSTKFKTAETLEEEAARIQAEEEALKAQQKLEEEKRAAKAKAEADAKAAKQAAEAQNSVAASNEAAQGSGSAAADKPANTAETARQEEQQNNSSSQSESSSNESESSREYESADSYSNSSKGQQIADYALQFVGNPYSWGGTSLTNGADCSGFVMSVFSDCGISVAGRTAAAQSSGGTSVSSANLQPGDLVFYTSGGRVSHVAIYIGNGQIVHAANSRKGIIVSSYNYQTPYKFVRYY